MTILSERIVNLESRLHEINGRISGLHYVNTVAITLNREDLTELSQLRDYAQTRLSQLKLKEAQSFEEDDIGLAVIRIFDELGSKLDRLFSKGH